MVFLFLWPGEMGVQAPNYLPHCSGKSLRGEGVSIVTAFPAAPSHGDFTLEASTKDFSEEWK
jgi:hypothetical protein